MRNPVPPATIRLRGIRSVTAFSDNKVWLDHKLLKLGKSLKVKAHSINGFGWGRDEKALPNSPSPFASKSIRPKWPGGCTGHSSRLF